MAESEKELKNLLNKKEVSEKDGLKLNIQKLISCHMVPYFMTSRRGNNGNSDRLFLGSKITADGDCSHEIKRHLLLGSKAMTNLDRLLKSRDITLLIKGSCSQSYDFSSSYVWM